jgi:hypothetical protein
MNNWHSIHITDKTGNKFFKTEASPMSTPSEIRNLQRHVDAIKANAKGFEFVDSASAVLMLDGLPYVSLADILMSDDELLAELGL